MFTVCLSLWYYCRRHDTYRYNPENIKPTKQCRSYPSKPVTILQSSVLYVTYSRLQFVHFVIKPKSVRQTGSRYLIMIPLARRPLRLMVFAQIAHDCTSQALTGTSIQLSSLSPPSNRPLLWINIPSFPPLCSLTHLFTNCFQLLEQLVSCVNN